MMLVWKVVSKWCAEQFSSTSTDHQGFSGHQQTFIEVTSPVIIIKVKLHCTFRVTESRMHLPCPHFHNFSPTSLRGDLVLYAYSLLQHMTASPVQSKSTRSDLISVGMERISAPAAGQEANHRPTGHHMTLCVHDQKHMDVFSALAPCGDVC